MCTKKKLMPFLAFEKRVVTPTNSNLEHVSDLIDNTNQQWKTQLISQNFIPIEAENILKLPLTNTTEDDLICWQGTKDGHYTVRSGYNAQMDWETITSAQAQPSNLLQGAHIWNKLWKIKAPPKTITSSLEDSSQCHSHKD
jgi:hypothetical protein